MTCRRLSLIGIMCLLCLFGCSSDETPIDEVVDVSPSGLVSANTNFAFKLFKEIEKQENSTQGVGQNTFISPLSVSIALAMTYNGAAGETQQAMAETLKLEGISLESVNTAYAELQNELKSADPTVELAIANSLWIRQGDAFNPDFLQRTRQFFESESRSLDFADPKSVDVINQWVAENTNDKIKKIIDHIGPEMVMFLINAIYFKAAWTDAFDPARTFDDVFQLLDGTTKPIKMMFREAAFLHYDGDGFRAVNLPYGDERISMYIFLPDRDSDLDEFLKRLTPGNWRLWMQQFREVKPDSVLMVPRFKVEYEILLNDVLRALGMGLIFEGNADFSGMRPGVFISFVKHKTFVEVNEAGTEAAAVTVVGGWESSPLFFQVNRPFFFAIRDNRTKTLLFMGTVTDPM